jgi:putative Mg2+ transporter-C (MgtC) family protein
MYLKKIDLYIKTHAKTMEIYLEYNEEFSMQNLSLYTEQSQYEIFDMEAGKIKTLNGEFGTLTFDVNFRHKVNHVKIIEEIRQLPGILYVREVA